MTAQAQQGAVLLGRTLNRTYYVERLLGGGGMGAVYAARHVRTGGLFAVKVLHRETATDSEIYKRFQDEARIVSGLRHPHIVQVTDFDCDEDGTPFIVMELLEGEDLYQRLCRVRRLSLPEVLDIARQVGSALHAAHEKGIVHRDVCTFSILCFDVRYTATQRRRNRHDIFSTAIRSVQQLQRGVLYCPRNQTEKRTRQLRAFV